MSPPVLHVQIPSVCHALRQLDTNKAAGPDVQQPFSILLAPLIDSPVGTSQLVLLALAIVALLVHLTILQTNEFNNEVQDQECADIKRLGICLDSQLSFCDHIRETAIRPINSLVFSSEHPKRTRKTQPPSGLQGLRPADHGACPSGLDGCLSHRFEPARCSPVPRREHHGSKLLPAET